MSARLLLMAALLLLSGEIRLEARQSEGQSGGQEDSGPVISDGAAVLNPDAATDDLEEIQRKCQHNRDVVQNMWDQTMASLSSHPWVVSELETLIPEECEKDKEARRQAYYRCVSDGRCSWKNQPIISCDQNAIRSRILPQAMNRVRQILKKDFDPRFRDIEESCRRQAALVEARIEQEGIARQHQARQDTIEESTNQIRRTWEQRLERQVEEKEHREKLDDILRDAKERGAKVSDSLGPVVPPRALLMPIDLSAKRPVRILYGVAPGLERKEDAPSPGKVDPGELDGGKQQKHQELAGGSLCEELDAVARRLGELAQAIDERLSLIETPGSFEYRKLEFLRDAILLQKEQMGADQPGCPRVASGPRRGEP